MLFFPQYNRKQWLEDWVKKTVMSQRIIKLIRRNVKMMVKPTVKELLEKVDNRFELVAVTAKRARQIANGDKVLTNVDEESPVTLAANEIAEGKVEVEE